GKDKGKTLALSFVGNMLTPDRLTPVALTLARTCPTAVDQCGTVKYGYVANQHEDLYVGRVDWTKSQKNSFFGRFSAGKLNVGSTFDGKNPLSINTYAIDDLDYQVAFGNTYLIGSNIVGAFRLSASRTNIVRSEERRVGKGLRHMMK